MEPTTQATMVVGLLALLLLLLVVRSVGRRRARRAEAATEIVPTPVAEQPEVEPESHLEPEVEPEPIAEAEPAVEVEQVVEVEVQAEVEVEPSVEVEPEPVVEVEVEAEVEPSVEVEPASVGRRGLRRRRPRGGDVAIQPAVTDAVVETADQAEVRALREQLRALEQVVQQQAADHPTAALARVEETAAQQSEAYLRQVSLVVRGLAAHTSEDENPRRTLARVAAAVERLGVPNQMERPILPVTKELASRPQHGGSTNPSHRLEAGGPQDRPVLSPVPDVFAGLAVPARFDDPVDFGSDIAVPDVHPSESDSGIPAYQLADAVLPVPPPAAPEVSGRRRGLSRKSR